MRQTFVVLLIAILTASCVTVRPSHKPLEDAENTIELGTTTKTQAEQIFGAPKREYHNSRSFYYWGTTDSGGFVCILFVCRELGGDWWAKITVDENDVLIWLITESGPSASFAIRNRSDEQWQSMSAEEKDARIAYLWRLLRPPVDEKNIGAAVELAEMTGETGPLEAIAKQGDERAAKLLAERYGVLKPGTQ